MKHPELLFLILYSLNLLALIGLLFFERRSYSSLSVWVLVLVLLPVVGFFVFLIFGKGPSIGKRKKFLHKIDSDEAYYDEVELQKISLSKTVEIDDTSRQLAYFNLMQQSSLLTDNNEVEIMTDIQAMYDQMFEDISQAKEYINVLLFIIRHDEYGKTLRELLIKKANEGVEVKIIYDTFGSFGLPFGFFTPLKKAGAKVCGFLPSIYKLFLRNVNYRNHRKIVVVDGAVAYVGGANVGKEYVNKSKRINPWHDTQIRVRGNAVLLINLRFMQDYNFTANTTEKFDYTEQPKIGDKVMQIVSSGPDSKDENIKLAYIKAINSAKKKIYIQTPYFIPDEIFLSSLIIAAQSGVDVRIMIPGLADKKSVYLCTTYYMKELLPYGIKFYKWKGFIHSKTLIVDDEIVSVGTFNIDIRSFKLDFEITSFIYNKETNLEMTNRYFKDIEDSTLVPADYKGSLGRRILEGIMRLFTPLM